MQTPTASLPGPQLALNDDVYFCVTEGQGIFLDLARDDYSAIPLSTPHTPAEEGFPDEALIAAFEVHRKDLTDALLLKESGTGSAGFQAYKSITRPTGHVFYPDERRAFGLTGAMARNVPVVSPDIASFFWASRKAAQLLKKKHIREIVDAVRRRKADATTARDPSEDLRRYTAVFRKLRPWYPAGYLCLYDALALIEFLAMKKIFPTWVFGVQAQPFGAHCWVQAGDQLLNETTEYANQFTPIMAI